MARKRKMGLAALRVGLAALWAGLLIPVLVAANGAITYGIAPAWVFYPMIGLGIVGVIVLILLILRAVQGTPLLGQGDET